MKRSNRLVLLVGVFLAVIAFVGVILLSQGDRGGTGQPEVPTTKNVVVATVDIPLGTVIDETMVETKEVDLAGAEADAYADVSQVIGQVARQEVLAGGQVTGRTTAGTAATADIKVPPGMRAMSVEVNQVSGVGTLIKTGDFVDLVIRKNIVAIGVDPETGALVPTRPEDGIDGSSTKLLLQGLQVLGTLLPPPTAATTDGGAGASPQPGGGGAVLNDQREIVILAVTPAQTEVIKYAEEIETVSLSLVLRSPSDFFDADGNPLTAESPCTTVRLQTPTPAPVTSPEPSPAASETPVTPYPCEVTPGIVLRDLVEEYGVLVNNPVGQGNLRDLPAEVVFPSINPDAFEEEQP